MDTSLTLPPAAAATTASAPALPRAVTTKVQAIDSSENTTLPADKPFVAQVVTARLSGSEYPENPSEITPPERTLRPYDVPMLPYDGGDSAQGGPDKAAVILSEEPASKDG